MSVVPDRYGLAALPGAQDVAISARRTGTPHEAAVALASIVLVALNLRAAVVCLPPIYDRLAVSFPVSPVAHSLIGTLPLLCFAAFGLLARPMSRKLGLERSLLLAMVMIAVGEAARAWLSSAMTMLAVLSVICLGGIGMGNVLLPPAIAHYFPNRVGLYAMADQTVSRDPGDSKHNLALFARGFVNVGNVQQLDWSASAGFVKTGTFAGRDNDTIGFLVSNSDLSD